VLSFALYAEAHCTQQNAQISGETLQDYRPWQSLEVAFLAPPSLVDEKREAQTPAGQGSTRGPDRCGASKGQSAFRLRGGDGALRRPNAASIEILEPLLFRYPTDSFELTSYLSW
jgi:hypothetical protein